MQVNGQAQRTIWPLAGLDAVEVIDQRQLPHRLVMARLNSPAEVFTAYFREREREDDENFVTPEDLALPGSAWVTPLDLDVQPEQVFVPPADKLTPAALGQAGCSLVSRAFAVSRASRTMACAAPTTSAVGLRVTMTNFEVGVLLRSATLSTGTSTFASGK